jgi:hypothetical protein
MEGLKIKYADEPRHSSPAGHIIRQKEPTNLEMPFDQLDSYLTPTELFYRCCQLNFIAIREARRRMRDHTAATAFRHAPAASARKIRSVDRETRWRRRLKVLRTAACMLRKR